jgi:hypothetical protein
MCTYVHVEKDPIFSYVPPCLLVGPVRFRVQVPLAASTLLFTEHVDATSEKTGLEEGVEIRLRHSLLLRTHRAA